MVGRDAPCSFHDVELGGEDRVGKGKTSARGTRAPVGETFCRDVLDVSWTSLGILGSWERAASSKQAQSQAGWLGNCRGRSDASDRGIAWTKSLFLTACRQSDSSTKPSSVSLSPPSPLLSPFTGEAALASWHSATGQRQRVPEPGWKA